MYRSNGLSLMRRASVLAVSYLLLVACSEDETDRAEQASSPSSNVVQLFHDKNLIDKGRKRLIIENPRLYSILNEGFGGDFSRLAAQHMFALREDTVDDVRSKTTLIEVAPRSWLVRLPIVNAAFFETDAGVVVVDTGYTSGGPVLLEMIRSVTDAPVHTIIYTHSHVDHAYGAGAFIEAGENPEVIAHSALPGEFDRYLNYRGTLARYMSQPEEELPLTREDLIWPTRVFDNTLDINVGGEVFSLIHAPAETNDQLYVWLPERRIVVTADYYQGFLPNAGNGKRTQRYVGEWSAALRAMAALEPQYLLPMHGAPMSNPVKIKTDLVILADAFDYIIEYTRDGLNQGFREDQIIDGFIWPEHFRDEPTLAITYVRPVDIVKMELKRWTGWWDDIPSHWAPASLVSQSQAIVDLAGGMDALVERTREIAKEDPALAAHFADMALFSDPYDRRAQELTLHVYKKRVFDKTTPTQERLAYFDHMALVRGMMLEQ